MNILVVGAGAVGQVFGRHLALGGANVTYFVRPQYEADCRKGFTMYPLNEGKNPIRVQRHEVVSKITTANWDYVVLCIPSTGLRGPWLDELVANIGSAYVVSLQPGPSDREYLLGRIPATRLISGMIGFMSYFAPLPGEDLPLPGTAYWFPPFSPSPFSGPPVATGKFVSVLLDGGLPAKTHSNVPKANAAPNAILVSMVVALEKAGWSFERLLEDENLKPALRAAREAVAVANRSVNASTPWASLILRPTVFRCLLRAAETIFPFNLEAFFQVHFTKVRPQILMAMRELTESKSTDRHATC